MTRKIDRSWIFAITGIIAGILIGIWVGYQLLGTLGSADLSDLDSQQRDDYVTLVAVGYASSQDLTEAQDQLNQLDAPNLGFLVAGVAERQINEGARAHELTALAQLANDLGVQNSILEPFLATPTPEEAPTATPLPPSPTPLPPTATPVDPTATPEPPTPVAEEPTPTPESPTATPTPAPAVFTDGPINVRSGPSTNYPVIGSLAAGIKANIVGRNAGQDWWQIELDSGDLGWVYSSVVQTEGPVTEVAVVTEIAPPPATPTPAAPPTATPVPKPAVDYVVKNVRLWSVRENGGSFDGPSLHCGNGHEIYVIVEDANGNRLNGVTVKRIYSGETFVTGDQGKGDGRVEFVMWSTGDQIQIIADGTGPVASETSRNVDVRDEVIPIPDFLAAGYCFDEGDCQRKIDGNTLCRGHYTWDVVFQRTY